MIWEPAFLLAPMDGMTHASFRRVCFDYGADGATTEMIQSLAYGRARRRLSERFLEKLIRLPGERWLAAQLIGSNPKALAASAEKLTLLRRFDAIEINMGCPARKVVGSGNGAALMRSPALAVEVMRAVRESTDLPVRLKMRLGWDDACITAPELARAAEALGFQAITLHGRTRAQMYRGRVDAEAIRRICRETSIPIYANGGVTCAMDALAFLHETGAAGVAIGRAALKQPWIFEDIQTLRSGKAIGERDLNERVGLLIRLAALACQHRPETVAIREMRKYCSWLLPAFTGAGALLRQLNEVDDLARFEESLRGYARDRALAGDLLPHPELALGIDLDTVHRE